MPELRREELSGADAVREACALIADRVAERYGGDTLCSMAESVVGPSVAREVAAEIRKTIGLAP